ncbi:MAG TPA: SBBP repeat-containing protein, partial [Ferruginibacter sp.]|nr:SBBP repeat-containing protein [Ferruginibacter sp.]
MKKILPILFFIFCGNNLHAQNVNFDWVAHFGEIYWEKGLSTTVDASGNVYSSGYFNGVIDFDPGPGVFTLSSINNTQGFLTKFDASRNFIWAKKIDGMDVHPSSIKINASGDLMILGTYGAVIDLDPGPAIVNGATTDNLFLIKLNAAGDFVWGKTFVSTVVFNKPFNLALDPLGNAYITGTFGNGADFDPGPGIYTMPLVGGEDIFILKLDVSGNFVWAKSIGSQSTFDEGNAIAVDGAGNVYITGTFGMACDFDPGPGIFSIDPDYWSAYVLKLNTFGDFVWAKYMKTDNFGSDGYSIKVDQSGNVYLGGTFDGLVDFDPGPGVYILQSNGNVDGFICKLDISGNFIWAKNVGAHPNDFIND